MADRGTRTLYILGLRQPDAMPAAMDTRLKRLLYRAHHMGSNENDLLFGGFAERYLDHLTPNQVERLELLLAETDNDLFEWVTGKRPAPAHLDDELMAMIRHYVRCEAART